jgi:hypothetical protein
MATKKTAAQPAKKTTAQPAKKTAAKPAKKTAVTPAKKTAVTPAKKTAARPAKKSAAKAGGGVTFADWGFRLAVIEALYEAGKLKREMARAQKAAADAEPYTVSAAARAILDAVPLTPELLSHVKAITTDGGCQVYAALTSEWDGEDELFDIQSLKDLANLPDLQELTLISMLARGVDVSPVAKVASLKRFFCQDGDWLKGLAPLKKSLAARGVSVGP